MSRNDITGDALVSAAATDAFRDECDELRRDADRYRKLRDEDAWGEDTSESGGSRWGELGEKHGADFDAVVDALPSNA